MGSYRFDSKFLFYKGVLYQVEGYDMDYSGSHWESEQLADGFSGYDIPLVIPRRVPVEEVEAVLINAKTFKDIVKGFTEKKILTYVDSSVACDCSLKDHEYEKEVETAERVELICRLLRIRREHENWLKMREVRQQKILVVCPEFILLDGQDKYDVIFFDDIQDIVLTLTRGTPLIVFKNGDQVEVETVSVPVYPYTLIRYY